MCNYSNIVKKIFFEAKENNIPLRTVANNLKKQTEIWQWIENNCDATLTKRHLAKKLYSAAHDGFLFTCRHGFGIELTENFELKFSKAMKAKCSCYQEHMNSEYIKCKKEISSKKQMETNLERYGVPYAGLIPNHKEKSILTNLKKYGHEWSAQNPNIHQKSKITCKRLYGVEFPLQYSKFLVASELGKQRNNPKEIQIKKEITNIKKYGVKHHTLRSIEQEHISKRISIMWKDEAVKNKQVQTLQQTISNRYNRKFPAQIYFTDEIWSLLNNKEEFIKEISFHGVYGFSKKYGVGIMTVYRYHKKHEITVINNSISSYQKEIATWLMQKNIGFESCNRSILGGKELDFYFPNHNIAIEFQGDFWHGSDRMFLESDIHPVTKKPISEIRKADRQKIKICKDLGIELLWIWEYDWNLKKEVIKNQICNKLGIVN